MRPARSTRRPSRPGDDPVTSLVGFTAVLRGAGLAITTDRVAAFLRRASTRWTSRAGTQTYWAGRLTLCADPEDLPRYDRAFDGLVRRRRRGGAHWITDERQPPPPKLAALDRGPRRRRGRRGRRGAAAASARASGTEVLRHRDLAELTDRRARAPAPAARAAAARSRRRRTSRRLRPARRGERRPRPHAARRAAQPGRGARRCAAATTPGGRARWCCSSTSPARWSPTPTRCCGSRTSSSAARPASTEVFTLGTRLTRVTRELRMRDAGARAAPRRARRSPTGRAAPGSARCCAPSSTGGGSGARPAAPSSWCSPTAGSAATPQLLGAQMAAAAPAGPPARLGQPARGQGRVRAGAGRNSRGPAVLGRSVGRAQPGHARGAARR